MGKRLLHTLLAQRGLFPPRAASAFGAATQEDVEAMAKQVSR